MPRFSIVIPVYNNAQYLTACLSSLRDQTFDDWEAIVVIDASPDDASQIAHGFAESDDRFVIIDKPVNEGRHLARKTGTEAAQGEYITYVDGDDELTVDALEQLDAALRESPVDILHFGMKIVGVGVSEEEAQTFEDNVNRPIPATTGRESVHLAFEQTGGYAQDWHTLLNAIKLPVAKAAFDAMCSERLDRAEDAYEYLALAAYSETQDTRTDIRGYKYYYGRGITGASALTANQFMGHVDQFKRCIGFIDKLADDFEEFDLHPAAEGARVKLVELMFNDWNTRLAEEDKLAVVNDMAAYFGTDAIAAELARISRDQAYAACVDGRVVPADASCYRYLEEAERLAGDGAGSLRYERFACAAADHLADLDQIRALDENSTLPIRIFIASHKPAERFASRIMQPIQVGSALAARRFFDTLHDDEGDNISQLNRMYCELTAQYWAWKNVDASYYGFCHYRRYFDFNEKRHTENAWGEIIDKFISPETQAEYCLDDDSIARAVEGWDIITTEFKDVRRFPNKAKTPVDHWHLADTLYDEDLMKLFAILVDMHPEFAEDVDAYANGTQSCFCNMFIMRKELFGPYCEWVFAVLDKFMEHFDTEHYSTEALRTPGHLAERLLNIYVMHLARTNPNLKHKQVQCVHFEQTDPEHRLAPPTAEQAHFKPVVPVVLAADNTYVPMLATTLGSMLANASDDYHYDIIIMTRNITTARQERLRAFCASLRSTTVTFYNVTRLLGSYKLTTNNEHISVETYYRFLIQDALPFYDKVLYLDSDLVICGDVSELYATELGDNMLGAVIDADYLGNLGVTDGKRLAYSTDVLNMKDPYGYFQAGVLVMNTDELRRTIPVRTWLTAAQDPKYIYNDQDILNEYCQGRVVYLDLSWNVLHDGYSRIGNFISRAPVKVYQDFLASRKNERVVHYAGGDKPWKNVECDRFELYWRYARQTPFYEELMAHLAKSASTDPQWMLGRSTEYEPLVDEDSIIRRIVDPILPLDSRRREFVRGAVQKVKDLRG